MVSVNLSGTNILKIEKADCYCIIRGISKTIDLMQNIDSTEKRETLWISIAIWNYKFNRNSLFFLEKWKIIN